MDAKRLQMEALTVKPLDDDDMDVDGGDDDLDDLFADDDEEEEGEGGEEPDSIEKAPAAGEEAPATQPQEPDPSTAPVVIQLQSS